MRLGRALFVGDAGLYAKANLAELSRGAGRYILATPINRVKEIKDEVLSRPGRYAQITPNLRAKEVIVGEGERRRRYILCLNTEEAGATASADIRPVREIRVYIATAQLRLSNKLALPMSDEVFRLGAIARAWSNHIKAAVRLFWSIV